MSKENELSLMRVYDAPLRRVWDAVTDSTKQDRWWGPRGWSSRTNSKDLRSGGHWDYDMHGPNGEHIPNRTSYQEVVPMQRLVYDHGGHGERPALFRVTMTFAEVHGKTEMVLVMSFETAEAARQMKTSIKQAGGDATWDRLAEYLGDEEGAHNFLITRSFGAEPASLNRMWTDPDLFSKWLPPIGFTMSYTKADVRPGGTIAYSMTNGEFIMHGRLTYREISPLKISYVMEFLDEKGNIVRHPALEVFPASLINTVTIAAESEASTRLSVESKPGEGATKDEMAAFVDLRSSMTQGWTGSFDKLDGLLG